MNQKVRCDMDNLHIPLAVLVGCVGSVKSVKLLNVPQGIQNVKVRVCPLGTPDAGSAVFYDINAFQDGNGDWTCDIPKTILTEECNKGWYEVRGDDGDSNLIAIGKGKFITMAFSTGTATAVPTEV